MKNPLSLVIPRLVDQTQFARNATESALVHVFPNILATLMLGANLNVFPTASVHVTRLALEINVKIPAPECAE